MDDEHPPWRPKLKNSPLFNPFEPSTEWTAQIGANDRIEVDDEEPTQEKDSAPGNPTTQKTDDQ